MITSLFIIVISSGVIWWFSNKLEDAAQVLGHRLHLPNSVKGALLYAVPSSFPEFCTVVIAVLVLKTPVFSVGVGTIAGSAVFNILIIPALSVVFATIAFKKKGQKLEGIKISSHIFYRDGLFYLLVAVVFTLVALTGQLSKIAALGFLLLYGLYVLILYLDTKKHRENEAPVELDENHMSLGKASIWMLGSMAAVGVACYFLVEHTIEISALLKINPYIVAVILTAAATSVPDTIISIAAAKKSGEAAEESIVNAFSSNIFDILICLSIPALMYKGTVTLNVKESIISLIMLTTVTIVSLVMFKIGNRVTKAKSYVLIALYGLFIITAIFNKDILILFGIS